SARHRDHLPPHSFPTRRSSDLRHGLNAITSSSTAARMMDEVRLYARLIAAAPTPFSTRERIQLWTSMRVTARISQSAQWGMTWLDRKSTRLNSSHVKISYAVFC